MVYNHTSQPSPSSIASPSTRYPRLFFFFPLLFFSPPFLDHSPLSFHSFPVPGEFFRVSVARPPLLLFLLLRSFCSLQLLEIFRNAQLCSPLCLPLRNILSVAPRVSSPNSPCIDLLSSLFNFSRDSLDCSHSFSGTISFVLSNFSDICLSAFPLLSLFPNNFPFIAFRFRYFLIYRSSARVFFYHAEQSSQQTGRIIRMSLE